MRPFVRVLTVATVVCLSASPALAAAKPRSDPETDQRLGPADGAGHYFGGQSSTSRFHGCRLSDEQWFPTSLTSGAPTTTPSTHRRVTFTVNTGGFPTFSWKAKKGYRICGVEAYAALAGPDTKGGELLAWVSYTSDPYSGSTAAKGKEAIKVRTPKLLGSDDQDLSVFAGKTLGIYGFQAVAVYVKKS
ncbi:MAG TPA: hypothetical protein VFG42_20265 [Baekduia sp.]|uniref:hypothetical protein n=1 Tax=Baekduia sp. TaxID=2600305 RepID=UPI002D76D296|nr:hypothetical protein [Baekduia sp.]HET6509141.1 hypothetical protein [Baekduia sp.]